MKLALCIPTHHGRAIYLRALLDSIMRQQGILEDDQVEICISDNASEDSTSELVERYRRTSPIPIKYFRFPTDMRGVRNFVNVVDMADAEYCWLLGSDDVIVENALARVLQTLREHPSIAGFTVNKLNFDKSLKSFVGVDHEIVLPSNPMQSRLLATFEEAITGLAMSFAYMSAHIFRRQEWNSVVRGFGIEYLCSMRHFPHCFVFAQIARKRGGWFWMADYLVVQRLDNFCLMEEKGNQASLYATELTEDMERACGSVLGAKSPGYSKLMKKLFIVYWNPWLILKYKSWPGISNDQERAMTRQCIHWFRRVPLFWATSYPLLVMPSSVVRQAKAGMDAIFRGISAHPRSGGLLRSWGRTVFHGVLRLLRIENEPAGHSNSAKAAAERYMARTLEAEERRSLPVSDSRRSG
jgi:abequosyltransferase